MKHLITFFSCLLSCLILNAQHSDLGRIATDEILSYFFNGDYKLERGNYVSSERIYKNCVFTGFGWGADAKIETNFKGRIDSIVLEYDTFSSAEHLKDFADYLVEETPGKLIEHKVTDRNLRYVVRIAESVYNFQTMYIDASWDFNSFGKFFFRSFRVHYVWTGLGG